MSSSTKLQKNQLLHSLFIALLNNFTMQDKFPRMVRTTHLLDET